MTKAYSSMAGRPVQATNKPLYRPQLEKFVPSLFAEAPHDSRSEQYKYISTREILNALHHEGFRVFYAVQGRSRTPGKEDFTKHMVRLRHRDYFNAPAGQDGTNEIILVNSHDGTTSYKLMSGYFRFVCQNGLVAGDILGEHRVTHRGDIGDIIDVAHTVLEESAQVNESRDRMRSTILLPDEQRVLAKAALDIRFEENKPITVDQALQARRYEDKGDDLWSTFNRLQENLIKGGQRGWSANGRRQTTRTVKGIDGLVGVNRGLWTLAEGMMQLKA